MFIAQVVKIAECYAFFRPLRDLILSNLYYRFAQTIYHFSSVT